MPYGPRFSKIFLLGVGIGLFSHQKWSKRDETIFYLIPSLVLWMPPVNLQKVYLESAVSISIHQLFPPLTRYHIPETFVTTFRNQLSVLRNKILKLQWWGHFGRIPSYRTTELLCFVRDTKSLNHQNRARQKINHECPKPSEDPKFQKSIDRKKPRINSGSKKHVSFVMIPFNFNG